MSVQFGPNFEESKGDLTAHSTERKPFAGIDLQAVAISPTGNVYGPFLNREAAYRWAFDKHISAVVEILIPPT